MTILICLNFAGRAIEFSTFEAASIALHITKEVLLNFKFHLWAMESFLFHHKIYSLFENKCSGENINFNVKKESSAIF